jgi:asparagine synthase (glutamine-hydrolysing)
MSGLFGVVDSKGTFRIETLIRDMARAMIHRDWYVLDLYSDKQKSLGLGRIGIGLFNSEKQPAVGQDGNLICFFCGDLSNSADFRKELKMEEGQGNEVPDSAVILRLYEEKGESFLREIEGKFVLSIWNKSNKQLLVANDLFGLYPLLYAHFKGRLIFAPEMKGILCDSEFRKVIDLTALADYMRFQTVLGERSFFEGITFLPGASVLRYNQKTDELRINSYWDFSEITENRVGFDDVVDETGRLLKRALNRIFSGPLRPGLFLSGGLDSRALVSLIDRKFYPLATISYGRKKSRDVVYAHHISRKLGSRHYYFDLENGDWVKDNADFHLEVTEGFQSWIHGRGNSALGRVRQILDVALFGFGQASVVAHSIPFSERGPADESDFFAMAYDFFNIKHTWPSINEAEEACLLTDSTYKHIRGSALASLRSEIERYNHLPYDLRVEILRLRNNQIKLYHFLFPLFRTHFEVYLPYLENRMAQFGLGLPLWMKREKKILRALINRHAPRLARIPYQQDGLIIAEKWFLKYPQFLFRRLSDRFSRHVFPFFPQHSSLDIDFEGYLRSDLKSWGEAILFDKRTLERGIFNPEFLRSIWARHQSGNELHTIGKIAPIMTYELMLRRFYD